MIHDRRERLVQNNEVGPAGIALESGEASNKANPLKPVLIFIHNDMLLCLKSPRNEQSLFVWYSTTQAVKCDRCATSSFCRSQASMAVQMIPMKRGEDAHTYRYLMPKLVLRPTSRSTDIVNTSAVCHDIGRTAICLRQWFITALSTTAGIDEATSEIQIRGIYDGPTLQNLVYDFIDVFVLCQSCENPETVMQAKGPSVLELHCRACGTSSRVQPGKSKAAQKMLAWILKNIKGKALQQSQATSDEPVDTLDDFSVRRDLF
jgi:translation initiation factor 2 beta subunit (eIF-2beta)/eIF-5